jgi:hypothetical protein
MRPPDEPPHHDQFETVHGIEILDDEDDFMPTEVASDRSCDFCGLTPTTHWLTFRPVPHSDGFTLPYYLGACPTCALRLDFRSPEDLMTNGNCDEFEAQAIARYFDAIADARPA